MEFKYYCDCMFDPSAPCQLNDVSYGVVTVYCPECEREFELGVFQFDDEGFYNDIVMDEDDS